MKPTPIEDLRDAAWAAIETDPERAVALAEQVLRRQPDPDAHYLHGVALMESGETAAGLEALERAVDGDPAHVGAWAALGRGLFDECSWEDARIALSNALRLDPHYAEALYCRACLRERRGDHDGAARDYAAAAAEAPDDYQMPIPLDDDTDRKSVV